MIHAFESKADGVSSQAKGFGGVIEPDPLIATRPINVPDLSKQKVVDFDSTNVNVEDVKPVLMPGFHYLDRAMKDYFSKIRIPALDTFKTMHVKIAGGDKSILIWQRDLKEGRAILPVMSINRTGEQFNPQKFSPPYMPIDRHFTVTDGSRIALYYRPTPSLVQYQLTIWSEHKRDAEYALYDIRTRFNPLAEIRAEDDYTIGNVQLHWEGMTDSSDKEAAADVKAEVRYDLNIVAEAWLSLPPKIVPTVLGRVTQLREFSGELFGTFFGEDFFEHGEE